jgi:signal transduction histidine kinase/ActR/RegA family two-component response regulator
MGMMVWDSGLVVRTVNEAWSRHVVPTEVGETVHQIGRRVLEAGEYVLRRNLTGDQTMAEIITESHRHKRRWEVQHHDGRRVRISTFPMQSGGVLAVAFDVSDRQDVERQARNLVSDAIDSLGDGVLLLDGHLNSLMFNRAYLRLFHDPADQPELGTTVTDLLRLSIAQGRLLLPDDQPQQAFVDRIRDSVFAHAETIMTHHPGGVVVEQTAYPTAMGGYVIVFRDITERRRAEVALRENEAKTRSIVESLGEGIALYDPAMRMEMHNPAFQRLVFGEMDLNTPGATLFDQFKAAVDAGVLETGEGDAGEMLDWILECVTGHKIDFELSAGDGRQLEASSFGTPSGGYLLLARNITARKKAEQGQREADELVRTIVDASPTTFLVSRLSDGKVIYAPRLSRERFGNITTTLTFFLDPRDREVYLEALLKTGSLTDYPVRFRRQDGSIMDGLTSARVIRFKGEDLIVSSTRDITEQLAMQAELNRQRELAHQNEKLSALGGLLAGVAHELNNPLSIVVANAMMLEDDIDDPALARRVERLSAAAKRSGRIVKTFLSMARNRPMRTEEVEISEILEAAVEISAYGLRSAGAEIIFDLDPSDPFVDVDADQIIQVLSNLLINAEHALRMRGAEGRVVLRTMVDGDDVVVEVQDNGPGVPETLRRRIFEPYFTTKEVGEGTGVGLAFCHRLVTAHDGKISVREAEGGGAIFRIELPRARRASALEAPPPDVVATKGAHVLVVDDEIDVATTISDTLQWGGYRTTLVNSAAEGLAQCALTEFDAILSDVRMPGTSGVVFFEDLRRMYPEQAKRLAFMTGDAMGRSVGGDGIHSVGRPFLEKPAEPKDILTLVAKLVEEGAGHGR